MRRDLVARPMIHDEPTEIGQPSGKVRDWRKGEVEPEPGKTMPSLHVVRRDFPNVHNMMTAPGPRILEEGVHAKGLHWDVSEQYEDLKRRNGIAATTGLTAGMPSLENGLKACEAILALSPETDGRAAREAWKSMEESTGQPVADVAAGTGAIQMTMADLNARPHRVITSPVWTGFVSHTREYAPFTINIEKQIPFHTRSIRSAS